MRLEVLVPSWRPHGIDRFSLCLCVKRERERKESVPRRRKEWKDKTISGKRRRRRRRRTDIQYDNVESKIFRQSDNPESGFSLTEQVTLCAV